MREHPHTTLFRITYAPDPARPEGSFEDVEISNGWLKERGEYHCVRQIAETTMRDLRDADGYEVTVAKVQRASQRVIDVEHLGAEDEPPRAQNVTVAIWEARRYAIVQRRTYDVPLGGGAIKPIGQDVEYWP